MNVAVIGAGMSGLASAYELVTLGIPAGKPAPEVTVYDVDEPGGNCRTARFRINGVERFADLAVNDFNARTYELMMTRMRAMGYTEYEPLEDTACFYDPNRLERIFCLPEQAGAVDPIAPMPEQLARDFQKFVIHATADADKDEYKDETIEDYVRKTGGRYGDAGALLDQVVLPRVGAMYFCDKEGAAHTLFRAVMKYYILQEGFTTQGRRSANDVGDRKYFSRGSAHWIEYLCTTLKKHGVRFEIDRTLVRLKSSQTGIMVNDRRYDAVVMACPADAVGPLFAFDLDRRVLGWLDTFHYVPNVSYLHADAAMLPRNPNTWRTYNVGMRGPEATYLMTYVENRHQNDAQNEQFDHYENPQFFVSCISPPAPGRPEPRPPDPRLRIPYELTNGAAPDPHFRHFMLCSDTLKAQTELKKWSGTSGIYFGAGWTEGAGLHEECWQAANRAAAAIVGVPPFSDPELDRNLPHYVLSAAGIA